VTTGQQRGFGDPYAVFILTNSDFRERNNHNRSNLTLSVPEVKDDKLKSGAAGCELPNQNRPEWTSSRAMPGCVFKIFSPCRQTSSNCSCR
jgi:hypothetical protein